MCLGPCVIECGLDLVERGSVNLYQIVYFRTGVSFGHPHVGELARHSSDTEARVWAPSHACRGHGVLAALLQPRAPGHGQVVKGGGRHLDTGPFYSMYVCVRVCACVCARVGTVCADVARLALLCFLSSLHPLSQCLPSTCAFRRRLTVGRQSLEGWWPTHKHTHTHTYTHTHWWLLVLWSGDDDA